MVIELTFKRRILVKSNNISLSYLDHLQPSTYHLMISYSVTYNGLFTTLYFDGPV